MTNFSAQISFIWSIAEILRGSYKQSEYGRVVLPFTVLRRLDCVLAPTKEKVLAQQKDLPKNVDDTMRETMLNMASGHSFHNISKFTFESLLDDPDNIAANLRHFVNGFSDDAREIFVDRFKFLDQIDRLDKDNLLYMVVQRFAQADLHPDTVSNLEMGYIFEELIRRFSEQSNETAGEHFTPREVIRLMVNLLFLEDSDALTKKGIIRRLYDPACGTGGMMSVAEDYLRELNPEAKLVVYGQELNDESYGTCKSDMMIKGQEAKNIHAGNSFTQDGVPNERFDYMLSNPPFGVEWKKVQDFIKDEHESQGEHGRFGAGLPRVSDGSLLFVQHMISKFNRDGNSSRLAVVLNGSPLFTGSAGSGESEIRRWIIENDFGFHRITVERPLKLNFQTSPERIEVLKQAKAFAKLKEPAQAEIIEALGAMDASKVYKNRSEFMKALKKAFKDAGVEVKTPMLKVIWNALSERDDEAEVCLDKKKNPEPDTDLRDNENIPLKEDIEEYFQREVIPHMPDAWIDHDKSKVGYEIPFNRHFYKYVPPRSLEEIDADLAEVSAEIMRLLGEVKG
jgi:type I restriction enzyme M protein